MSFTSRGTTEILVAGYQDTMFLVDLNKGEVTRQVGRAPTARRLHARLLTQTDRYRASLQNHEEKPLYLCSHRQGHRQHLGSRDVPDSQTWVAHSSFINDMDVQSDFVVTCGASLKQQGTAYMFEPLRQRLRPEEHDIVVAHRLPTPGCLRPMHPRMVTTSIVVSTQGQMHIIDLMNQTPATSSRRTS